MPRALALLLLILPATAAAQQEAALSRDRIALLHDSVELREIEQQHARARTNADDFVAAFAALRRWEVTGNRRDAQRAREYFDRVATRDPGSAWAHYGHALTLAADMDRPHSLVVTHISAQRALGHDAVSRARRALERAVTLDPELPGARELLTRYAAETHDRAALQQARASYERTIAGGDAAADVYIGLAVATRELGDAAASIDAARHATRRAPAYAPAHLELAASLALAADSALQAGTAWFTALRFADPALLARMWDDVALIVQPAERAAWQRAASDDERRDVLRSVWRMRGALAALTPEERAAEHYARLHFANQAFRRQGMFGAAPLNALRWEQIESRFDDRGVIYIRHGRPLRQIRQAQSDRITWIYADDDTQPLSFHFQLGGTAGWQWDYVLVRDLHCSMDAEVIRYDRRLAPLGRDRCGYSLPSVSRMIRDDAERALATDTHRPTFATPAPFHYDWYSFRGDAGRTAIVLAVGVPAASVPRSGDWQVALTIADTARGTVLRAAARPVLLPLHAQPEQLLRAHIRLDAEPARAAAYRVDLRSDTDRATGMVYGGTMPVPGYDGDTLMLSDVLIAQPTELGTFTRGGHTLDLSPTQLFRGGDLRVYFEIYNLPPRTAYRTQIVVVPLGAGWTQAVKRLFGRDDPVKLQFDDVAADDAGPTIAELRDVQAPFPPGAYELRVTITVPGAKPLTRTRRFRIE